jgi:hypothetical protein
MSCTCRFLFAVAIAITVSPSAVSQQGFAPPTAATQSERKLELEIRKLEREVSEVGIALQLTPLFLLLISLFAGYVINKRLNALKAAEDKFSSLTDERARAYAEVYKSLGPTALFFSPVRDRRGDDSPQLTRQDCDRMGHALSTWYFGLGGLMMTTHSRDAYFTLMEALRLAAIAPGELAVQTVGEHATRISMALVTSYRKRLAEQGYPVFATLEGGGAIGAGDVALWRFGRLDDADEDAVRFKDFVLIQTLASRLRTSLTDDIGSRRPPASSRDERYRNDAAR